jgi:hypothetical protein
MTAQEQIKDHVTSQPEPKRSIMRQTKNTICLWYDKDAEEAANFYAATFPDSGVCDGQCLIRPGAVGCYRLKEDKDHE